MAKKSTNVVDVQGLATTKFDEIKDAWKELAERAYEDSVQDIVNELGNGVGMCDPDTVRRYLDEAEAAQNLYSIIDECEDMEGYEDINFKKYLTDMRITNMEALMEYAIDVVDIDVVDIDEIVNEMCKVFD